MSKRSRHPSVADMARSLSEGGTFPAALEERLQRRQLIKALAALRAKGRITQEDVAKHLSCTQAKVSKLESGEDADARLGDLIAYTEAVGYEMHVSLVPKGQTMVERVKMHALIIDRLLREMVRGATGDGSVKAEDAKLIDRAAVNLADLVGAAESLPSTAGPNGRVLQVEVSPHENGCDEDHRPRKRRRGGESPPASPVVGSVRVP